MQWLCVANDGLMSRKGLGSGQVNRETIAVSSRSRTELGSKGCRDLQGSDAGTVDFAPRYFTTASRDLHRAVEWYAHLKESNL
jgi:hypothetical protein